MVSTDTIRKAIVLLRSINEDWALHASAEARLNEAIRLLEPEEEENEAPGE
jgi:hypothetical protein